MVAPRVGLQVLDNQKAAPGESGPEGKFSRRNHTEGRSSGQRSKHVVTRRYGA